MLIVSFNSICCSAYDNLPLTDYFRLFLPKKSEDFSRVFFFSIFMLICSLQTILRGFGQRSELAVVTLFQGIEQVGGGVQFAMTDGSVRFVSENVDLRQP